MWILTDAAVGPGKARGALTTEPVHAVYADSSVITAQESKCRITDNSRGLTRGWVTEKIQTALISPSWQKRSNTRECKERERNREIKIQSRIGKVTKASSHSSILHFSDANHCWPHAGLPSPSPPPFSRPYPQSPACGSAGWNGRRATRAAGERVSPASSSQTLKPSPLGAPFLGPLVLLCAPLKPSCALPCCWLKGDLALALQHSLPSFSLPSLLLLLHIRSQRMEGKNGGWNWAESHARGVIHSWWCCTGKGRVTTDSRDNRTTNSPD